MEDPAGKYSPVPIDLLNPNPTEVQAAKVVHSDSHDSTPSTPNMPNESTHHVSVPAWVIILIILIVSVAAAAGILIYQSQNTPGPAAQVKKPQVTPSPTKSPDEVSNDDSVGIIEKEITGTKVDSFATDSAALERDIGNL
jgi:hypothetical protein